MASINLIPGILTIQAKPLNIFSQKKLVKIKRVTAQEMFQKLCKLILGLEK